MSKRKTIEQFIKDARVIHGNKYDYSKSTYVTTRTPLTIVCPLHGEFNMRPNDHLSSEQGCYECGRISKIVTTEEFITNAQLAHNGEYDYSKSIYVGAQVPLIITCNIHGDFKQKPNDHVSGKTKCPACVRTQLTTIDFITQAQQVHGTVYDYSKVKYISSGRKVIIICNIHGEFKQSYDGHVRQHQGCPTCAQASYSEKAIDWLTHISNTQHILIQHALNSGEFRIPTTNLKVDGYCRATNTIYEFLGDFWHGNPNVYPGDHVNRTNYKTFGELYERTLERNKTITSLGYNLITIWESDWKQLQKQLQEKQNGNGFFKNV